MESARGREGEFGGDVRHGAAGGQTPTLTVPSWCLEADAGSFG
jgi:hypothetical protein